MEVIEFNTEDGIISWDRSKKLELFIVFTDNHSFDKGTIHERELYKTFKATIHAGAGVNRFGAKFFKSMESGNAWVEQALKNK